MSTSSLSLNLSKMSCFTFTRLMLSLSDTIRVQSSNTYKEVLSEALMSDIMLSVIGVNGIAGPVGSPQIHILSARVPPLTMPPHLSLMSKILEFGSMFFLILSVDTFVIVNIIFCASYARGVNPDQMTNLDFVN